MSRPSFIWMLPLVAAAALCLSACDDSVTVPEAMIWAPEQLSATIGDSIVLYGVYLGDPGDIARFSWDLTSDGIFDYTYTSQGWDLDTLGIYVAYAWPGEYVVTLQATTVTNKLYRTTTDVSITDLIPQVDANVPTLLACGETTTISARVIDDAGFKVWWDLDANGSPDTVISFVDTVELASEFSPTGPGVRNLSFVALDNDDHRIEESFDIIVGLEPVWVAEEESPAPMEQGRWAHASALHGGKIYVFGGRDRSDVLDSVEIYDPVSDSWTEGAPMPTPRWSARAYTYGDSIYVIGGYRQGGSVFLSLETYCPSSDEWGFYSPADSSRIFPEARIGFGLDELRVIGEEGFLLMFGGFTAGNSATNNYKYRFETGGWQNNAYTMKYPRRDFGSVESEGLTWVVGGTEDGASPTAELEYFDPSPKNWIRAAAMPTARRYPAMAAWGEHLYVFGGETADTDASDLLEVYDLQTKRWSRGPVMPRALAAASAHTLDGRLYVIGGHTPSSDLGGLHVLVLTPWRCSD